MKIPIGDLDLFDIWFGVVFIIVVALTASCTIEISNHKSICNTLESK